MLPISNWKFISTGIKTGFMGLMACIFLFGYQHAAQAGTTTWSGGGADNNWSNAANWDTGFVPTSSDPVIFNGSATKNVTVNVAANAQSVTISAGYTGTMTTNNSLTVTNAFTMADGTFSPGIGSLTVGSFNLSGGTFTSPSVLTDDSSFTLTGGTFNHNNGKLLLTGGSFAVMDVPSTITFYDVEINRVIGVGLSGDTYVILNNLTLTQGTGIETGTLDVRGNITQAEAFGNNVTFGGTGIIDFGDDTKAQTYTITGGRAPVIRLNSAADANDTIILNNSIVGTTWFNTIDITSGFAGTVNLQNNSDEPLSLLEWKQQAGSYDASSQSQWTVKTFTVTGGSLVMPELVNYGNCVGSLITWDFNGAQTFKDFNQNCSTSLTLNTGDSMLITGDATFTWGKLEGTVNLEVQGNVTVQSAFVPVAASTPTLTLSGNTDTTFNLTTSTSDFNGDITINKTGGHKVTMLSALVMDQANQDLVIREGTLSLGGKNLTVNGTGSTMTIEDGGTVSLYGTETLSVNVGQPTWLTGSTLEYSGDGDNVSDTINISALTTTPATNFAIKSIDPDEIFQLNAALTVNGNFTHDGGELDMNDYNITVLGETYLKTGYCWSYGNLLTAHKNITLDATYTEADFTLDFGGAGPQDLTINNSSGPLVRLDSSADANDEIIFNTSALLLGMDVTAGFGATNLIPITNAGNHTLTITSWDQDAGVIDASSQSAWRIGNFTRTAGTFTAPTTVTAYLATSTWDVPATQTFNNLTIGEGSGIVITGLTLGNNDTFIVTGDLVLQKGKLNTATATINARGAITQNATYVGGGTAVINFDNAGPQTYTVNGGVGPTVRLDAAVDASDSVTFTAPGTITKMDITSGFGANTIPVNAGTNTATFTTWSQAAGNLSAGTQTAWNISNLAQTGGTFTPPQLVTATSGTSSWDVATSATFNNLNINRGGSFTIAAGDTFNINGTLTLTNGTYDIGGTMNTNGATVQAVGFDGGTGTVDFNSASAQTYTVNGGAGPTVRLNSSSDASDSITFTAPGTITKMDITSGFGANTIPVNAGTNTATFTTWSQAAGNLSAGAQTAWNIGTLTISGGSFIAPQLVTATGTTATTWDILNTQTFNNLTVNKTSGTLTIALSDDLVISNDLILEKGTIASSGNTDAQVVGDLIAQTGFSSVSFPITLNGAMDSEINLNGATSSLNGDITINKTAGFKVDLHSTLVEDAVNQDLTVTSGTLKLNGNNLTVNGSGSTIKVQTNGIVSLIGSETITKLSNPTMSTSSIIEYTGDGDSSADTYTITNFTAAPYNLKITSTDGATDTYQLGTNIDINGTLTNTGAFDVSVNNYTINLAGSWINSGTFNARSGNVILDGNEQSLTGSLTFYDFIKSISVAGFFDIKLDNTATYTFINNLTLHGLSSASPLVLWSDSNNSQADINPQGTVTVDNLLVTDSNNINANAIVCNSGCTDFGNNTNWTF